MVTKPLEAIRILDFTHGVAGPYASMILADLGADVIKVEKPGRGDATRYLNVSKKFVGDIPRSGGDYFLAINRNKRAVTIDLKHPEGQALALRLANESDAVMQSFRPGVMDRLGLGYESVRTANPAVVYGSVSGYGSTGPLANHPGMDVTVQARAGVLSITGYADSPPVKPGVSISDFSGGAHMAIAMLAGITFSQRTGQGQHVEVSLMDATMSMLANYCVAVIDSAEEIAPMGSGHPQLVPFQAFETSDGYVVIGTGTNKLFRSFCTILGREDLAEDPRYARNELRVQNREPLIAEISAITRTRSTNEWIAALEWAGIPCSPVNTLRQAFAEEQLKATNMVVEVPHPIYGAIHLVGVPQKMSASPCAIERAAPMLGEHNDEIFRDLLGLSEETLAELREKTII